MTIEPSADYWLDNYGTCRLGVQCKCIRQQKDWPGRLCEHWVPLGVTSFESYRDRLLAQERSSLQNNRSSGIVDQD